MKWLQGMIDRGRSATAGMWPSVRRAFGWVHRAAHVLGREKTTGSAIRCQLGGLLGAMTTHRARSCGRSGTTSNGRRRERPSIRRSGRRTPAL